MAESPDQYKRRVADDIKRAQINVPTETSADFDIDEEEIEDAHQPKTDDNANETAKVKSGTPEEQIQQAEVPEFKSDDVFTPAAVKEAQPGGPAVQPRETAQEKAKEQAEDEKKTATKRAAKPLADVAGDAVKKAVGSATKWAAQIGTKIAATTAGYWLPILLAIVGIVIIVVALVFLIRALQTPNVNGSSPVEATDILHDRPWISKILALSGNSDVTKSLTADVLSGLQGDLAAMKNDLNSPPLSNYDSTTKAKISAKIDEIVGLVKAFQTLPQGDAKENAAGLKIVTAVGQLLDIFATVPFHFSGETAYPISPKDVKGFNSTLHGGSFMRCESVPGHGTFINNNKCTNDATDIGDSGGTPVYAAFSGHITKRGNHSGDYIYIEGKDSVGKTFRAVYAHMQSVTSSDDVTVGQKIGASWTGLNHPHLHFELLCDNHAVTTTAEDVANFHSSNKKYNVIGEYLYVRDLSVLNKTP